MMKFKCLLLAMLCLCLNAFPQENISAKYKTVLENGFEIYRIEKAKSLAGFLFYDGARIPASTRFLAYNIGNFYKAILYYPGENPVVFGTVTVSKADLDSLRKRQYCDDEFTVNRSKRPMSVHEKELMNMSQKTAFKVAVDTIFRTVANSFSIYIPVIKNATRKVYVLNTPYARDEMILGNDFVIEFDKQIEVKSIKRIHEKSYSLPFTITAPNALDTSFGVHHHKHEKLEGFTATDIALILLNYEAAHWRMAFLEEEHYATVFDLHTKELLRWKRADFAKEFSYKTYFGIKVLESE